MELQKIGVWAFIIGLVIALLASFITLDPTLLVSLLVLLGLIVGVLNVTDKETNNFLIATVSLALISYLGAGSGMALVPTVGPLIINVLGNFITFVMPAVIIVAVKAVYNLAKD